MAEDLNDHLRAEIKRDGPISVATFMAEALGNPQWGYYQTKEPFGRLGDFTTAPEISQIFGELIGIWCAQTWLDLHAPEKFNLVELGPGRGTLMMDALRSLKVAPQCLEALEVHLVETSPRLRGLQKELLLMHAPDVKVHWHEDFRDVPKAPLVVVANEFFDALPVRQFVKAADGWYERLVGLSANGESLNFLLSKTRQPASEIPDAHKSAEIGATSEICPLASKLCSQISEAIRDRSGSALIIDYGPARSAAGDSLQALRAHKYVGVLEKPGTADITAHVDFEALSHAAKPSGLSVYGPKPLGKFLEAMGIEVRASVLAASADKTGEREIAEAVKRLTGSDAMGDLFKVLVLTSSQSTPAGF